MPTDHYSQEKENGCQFREANQNDPAAPGDKRAAVARVKQPQIKGTEPGQGDDPEGSTSHRTAAHSLIKNRRSLAKFARNGIIDFYFVKGEGFCMRLALVLTLEGLLVLAGLVFAQNSQYQELATIKQIMAATQGPAMNALVAFNKAGGPKDDKEWEQAGADAAVLAETSQLLLMGARPAHEAVKQPENGDARDVWVKSSQRLQTAALASAKAAEAKDLDAWKASVNQLGGACRSCHTIHRKPTKKSE